MNTTYLIVMSLGIISIAVSLILIMETAKERPSKEQTRFMLLICFVMLTCLAGFLEVASQTTEAALIAVKFGYVGRIFSVLLLPRFIMEYSHFHFSRYWRKAVWVVNGIILGLIFTCERHSLYYTSFYLDTEGNFPCFRNERGIFFYLLNVETYLIFIYLICFLIGKVVKVKAHQEKSKYRGMLFGLIVTAIGIIVGQFGMCGRYDPLPFSLMTACLIFLIVIKKYHMFDISQNAKECVLDNAKMAVMILNREKEVLYTNRVFNSLGIQEIMDEQVKSDDCFEQQQRELHVKDRYLDIRNTGLHHEDGTLEGYLLQIRDVTEQKNNLFEMARLKKEAESANLSKSSFLANMSHEIRTPIHAVNGMNEMILRETTEPAIREYAGHMKAAGKELLSLVNDILDFSKIESGKMMIIGEKYSVNDMLLSFLDEAKELLLQASGEKDRKYFYIKKEIPSVLYGDKGKVKQIFIGIVKNAISLGHYKNCTFEINFEMLKDEKTEHETKRPMVYLEFMVHHKQNTTDPAIRERIFSTSDSEEIKNRDIENGRLSFALVDILIRELGGKRESVCLKDGGEDFIFYIPQEIVDEKYISNIEEMVAKSGKKKKDGILLAPTAKVLVVDDNQVNLKVVKGLLKRTKMEVQTATSGRQCLAMTRKEEYDLIFMDHMMPEMDGIETLEALKKDPDNRNREKPIIILTANMEAGAKEMYCEKGFTDYLMKPVEVEALENMLRYYLPEEKL